MWVSGSCEDCRIDNSCRVEKPDHPA
jgi:hypothetical protein